MKKCVGRGGINIKIDSKDQKKKSFLDLIWTFIHTTNMSKYVCKKIHCTVHCTCCVSLILFINNKKIF